MKKVILLIAFCLSLSAIYAQTIDVIHLKNGFDARGTITNRTESQIILQSENGRTLTIDMSEIESMEQEQKAFDPRVLIGRWACYKANGERDARFDMEIDENEGFYKVSYERFLLYQSKGSEVCNYYTHCTPYSVVMRHEDIDVEDGDVSYYFLRVESSNDESHEYERTEYSCDITLKYKDGKLKGNVDCLHHFYAMGNSHYKTIAKAVEHGCGTVFADGPCGKWNVYFVKY